MRSALKRVLNLFFRPFGLEVRKYIPPLDTLEWVKFRGIKTVIDVGANTGQFAAEIRKKLPDAMIYSFEPVKPSYNELVRNRQGDSKFRAFHCALGDSEGTSIINVSSYSLSSSLLPMAELHKEAFPHSRGSTEETITVKRLDSVFSKLECPKNILLKIDVQGFEDKVLRGGEKTLGECEAIMVETSFYPLYESQPLFSQVYEKLTSMHFKYAGNGYGKKHPRNKEVISDDSFFVRER
ncbi:MAG TPA: FkbM family methyltransferase [Candidatus Paceibacterota bacterium]